MDMASEQAFLGSSWHRPEHFTSPVLPPAAATADVSAGTDSFYRHHGMDATSPTNHGGYFKSRAAAMHGFRSTGASVCVL